MKILVVDDGQLAINSLIRILCRVAPDCDYISAMTTDDALTWLRQGPMDAAFLNLEMPGMNGLALARMIQKIQPRCNLIVVTEHPEYAVAMIDYQYSDEMVNLMNWGVEGETYTETDETKTFVDDILNDATPATKSAEYGLTSSSVCRTGIPFNPLDFNAMLEVA